MGIGTHGSRGRDVLSEHYALSLDDEEVGKLVDVANHGIEGLAGHRVVFARAELASQAAVHDSPAGNLGSDGDAEHHPRELEAPSQHIQVPNREDEGNDGGIGNGGSPCVQDIISPRCIGRGGVVTGRRREGGKSMSVSEGNVRGLFHDRSSEKKEW